jgi:ParB/RepB/Spo0J family partition protein
MEGLPRMSANQQRGRHLRPIAVTDIEVNPYNPRGQDPSEDESFLYLVQSVKDFGVLVPLLVKPIDHERYQLIDGERRLLAARAAAVREVPAYVMEEPLPDEAIQQTMFHIHHNRQSWKPDQECKALLPLYRDLVRRYGLTHPDALARELVKRTGMNKRTARNRLQFLRWPDEVRQAVHEGKAPYWFVVELEDKIVEPALANYPGYFERVPVDDVRRYLFNKWEQGVVGAAESVRAGATIARYKPPPGRLDEAEQVFDRLVTDAEYDFGAARDDFVRRFPDAEEPPPKGPRALQGELLELADTLDSYNEQYVIEGLGRSKVEPGLFVAALERVVEAAQHFVERITGSLD